MQSLRPECCSYVAHTSAALPARPAPRMRHSHAYPPRYALCSWNFFRCNINETIIREVVDAIVASGLRDAGAHALRQTKRPCDPPAEHTYDRVCVLSVQATSM
jgi:hypothetical protein